MSINNPPLKWQERKGWNALGGEESRVGLFLSFHFSFLFHFLFFSFSFFLSSIFKPFIFLKISFPFYLFFPFTFFSLFLSSPFPPSFSLFFLFPFPHLNPRFCIHSEYLCLGYNVG